MVPLDQLNRFQPLGDHWSVSRYIRLGAECFFIYINMSEGQCAAVKP